MRSISLGLTLIICLTFWMTASATASDKSSKETMTADEFASAVVKKIGKEYPQIKVIGVNDFALKMEVNGNKREFYLNNTYSAYCVDPARFDDTVDGFLQGVLHARDERESSWKDAKPRLFPSLKPRAYLENTLKSKDGAKLVDNLITFKYDNDLTILIAIDSEQTISYASKHNLEVWNVTKEEALSTAMRNLASLTAPHWKEAAANANRNGVYAFMVNDCYDSSRILLPDFYEHASKALGCKKIAVGIPYRDYLIAISADDPKRLKKMKDLVASECDEYPYPVSPELFFLPKE